MYYFQMITDLKLNISRNGQRTLNNFNKKVAINQCFCMNTATLTFIHVGLHVHIRAYPVTKSPT